MAKSTRKWPRRLRLTLLALLLIIITAFSFGISGSDSAACYSFSESAKRWQFNPEFRKIAIDYCVMGSHGTRIKPFGVLAGDLIMGARSAPFLPKEYAVNPTSAKHYEDFARGPLSAYLHLCSEQDVAQKAPYFVQAAQKSHLSEDDLRIVLNAYKMDFPVVTDRGACQSVADVIHDTDAARDFPIQDKFDTRLAKPIAEIATALQFPTDEKQMTAAQQQTVLDRLDGYLRANDPELWRTKQINDFSGGVWAQVYGPAYNTMIVPIMTAQRVSRILLVVILAGLALRRRPSRSVTETRSESPNADIHRGIGAPPMSSANHGRAALATKDPNAPV